MARIGVPYQAPITVIVDTETRTVERVIVWDEETTRLDEGSWHNYDLDNGEVSSEEEADAKEIAVLEPWPAWSFGW